MKRDSEFEKKIKNRLSEDLEADVPNVWEKINSRICESAAKRTDESSRTRHIRLPAAKKRKIAVAAAAVAVVAGAFWVATTGLPLIQVKAATLYDSGGCLTQFTDTAPAADFVDGYNGFGLDLLKQLGGKKQNVFLSPASVYLALGMASNGAQGGTAADFQTVLHTQGENSDAFNRNCTALQSLMSDKSFRLANSIWIDSSFRKNVSDRFLKQNSTSFGATVGTLDFSSAGAPGIVNSWVKHNTAGRINSVVEKFPAKTVMAMVDTVYFKANWANQFEGGATSNGNFQTPSGEKTVKFMHGVCPHYFEDGTLQGILLPYENGKTSMMILLPKTNLAEMLKSLTPAALAGYVKNNMKNTNTAHLSLPRVNLEYRAELSDVLKSLGLRSAFDPQQANFGGIVKAEAAKIDAKKTGGGLYLSDVLHQTYLAVDEKGTEAAAATVIMASGAPPCRNVMNVDRPFLAAIVDNKTGAALFLGTIADPAAAN